MRRCWKRFSAMFASVAACMVAFAGIASAHVTVWPQTSTVGAWEKYTMRVPTEKDVPTVKVVLKIPNGVTFEQYEAVPGWSVTEQKDASGNVTTVTWTATSGGVAPGQFAEFPFVAQNPKTPEDAAWNAFQYYKDGSIVEWTGDKNSETPHSITTIMAASANTPSATTGTVSPAPSTSTSKSSTWLPTTLSIVAILLSIGSIFVSARSKRKN
jgi:uncharacterized protein YcnI